MARFLCFVFFILILGSVTAKPGRQCAFYQEAFHQLPTPTMILDDKYQIVDLSDSYVTALRSTRAECISRNAIELIRERLMMNEADRLIWAMKEAYDDRSCRIVEILDSSKRHFWNVHVRPWPRKPRPFINYFTPHKTRQMMTLQSTDLTAVVEHNTRMNHNAVSADIYHLLVKDLDDFAIFMLDVHGHVKTWNAGAEKLYQYTEDEIVGRHFTTFIKEEDLAGRNDELRLALAGQLKNMEGWRVRRDGSQIWCAITVTPLYNHDHLHIGFAKTTQDLTSRLSAEKAMIDADVQATKLKQHFLSMLSHEISLPLMSVLSGVHNLSTTMITPDQAEIMNGIQKAGQILTRTFEAILDQSKLQAKAVTLHMSNIVLRDMMKKLVDPYRQKTHVPIHVRISEDVPDMVSGDVKRIQLVLMNLIDNAVKYTSMGFIVITIKVKRSGDCPSIVPLLVSVRDTGVGLSNEEMECLFEPFVKAKANIDIMSDTYCGDGLGLGLSNSKQCIELMKGKMWVDSQKGYGSIFSFTLNLERRDQEVKKNANQDTTTQVSLSSSSCL